MNQYQLVVKTGPAPGKTFALSKNELTIGRDANNEITINDAEISRHHSKLVLTGDGYAIEDMGSTNGTYIDEKRISAQTMLKVGNVVRLGDNVQLIYEYAGLDPDATIASSGKASATPMPAAPTPAPAAAPPPAAKPAQPAYGGQMAQGPAAEGGKKPNRNLMIGCGVLLVIAACVVIGGLWYIDSNYLWCDVFGGLIGACR
jgi:pSer/pThr/pTyr-binding forkhead associated (FHA) protein